ncbi:MAG: ATP-binding protein [Bradymonadia bacterium]
MDPFIGRERELSLLRRAATSTSGDLIPIYGRRRVGKSALIIKLLSEHLGVYHLGQKAPAELQRRAFLQNAAIAADEPLLAHIDASDWHTCLLTLTQRWPAGRPLLLAFDEFQWTVEASPELPSVLQGLWDQHWRHQPTLIMLCGSFIGFMEREVLGQESPLFGRRTAQIHLQPFGHREARAFHPNYSLADAARTHFICGGVPQYLKTFDDQCSVEMNIRSQLLDEFAPLYREPEFLLREELREVRNYHAILMALARSSASVSTLARATALPERSLPYYLQQLEGLGYVRRRQPLSPGAGRGRRVRYTLDDPLLKFWFRFVFPHQSALAQQGPSALFDHAIKPHLPGHFGLCFERMCRLALPALYAQEGVSTTFEIGEFWNAQVQIDVVSVRADDWVDLGECKWGTVSSAPALLAELQRKRKLYPNPHNASVGLRAFTRNRPETDIKGLRWHTLEDVYGIVH